MVRNVLENEKKKVMKCIYENLWRIMMCMIISAIKSMGK